MRRADSNHLGRGRRPRRPAGVSPALAADKLPNVVVLATGGTIAGAAASDVQAGYTSGQVGVDQLLAAVPQAKKLATMRGEQIANIGSQDMNDEVWLKLARRVNELVAMPDVDGVVITHGTDTIEETGLLPEPGRQVEEARGPDRGHAPLDRALRRRPPELLQRGGGGGQQGRGRARRAGGGQRLDPRRLLPHQGQHHRRPDLPLAPAGPVGTVAYGECEFYRGPVGRNTVDSEFSLDGVTALPRVDIVMAHENMDGALIDAAVAAGAKGVVIAGVGNGNMTKAGLDALAAQAKKGIVCVRSTRVATGRVGRKVEVDDDALGARGLGRPEPPEVARAASPRAAEDAQPGRHPTVVRRVLKHPEGGGRTRKVMRLSTLAAAVALCAASAPRLPRKT